MSQSVATNISGPIHQANVDDDPIEVMARTVYSSSALNNDFYDLWTSRAEV